MSDKVMTNMDKLHQVDMKMLKEVVSISNLDKRALNEIEDNLTKNILEKKPIKND